MVKVFGPMMSLDASGTLGKAITFSKWKGRNYVRERVIPANPKSGAQVGRRAMFKKLTQIWSDFDAGTKALWQPLADQLVASPFNAYVSFNMRRWHNFKAPATMPDPAETGTAADDTLSAAAWEENRIKLSSEITATAQGRGSIIFADPTPGFTAAVGNAIIVIVRSAVATYELFWTPPTVQAYSFNIRPYTGQALLAVPTGEQTATP